MVPEGSIADGATAPGRDAPAAVGGERSVSGLFPIRVVAQLTGINAVTIRAWERRYGLVRPERTPGGHRLYSRPDVDRLRSAAGLVAQGMPISRAARLLAAPTVRRSDPDENLVDRFVARSRELDDEGMSALYDSVLASDPGGTMAGLLLEALPGAWADAPPAERAFVEAWLLARLGAGLQQRIGWREEPRVVVARHGGSRAWGLVLALLLLQAGQRPLVLDRLPAAELGRLVRRLPCLAVVMEGELDGQAARLPEVDFEVPVFVSGSQHPPGTRRLEGEVAAAARQLLALVPGRLDH